MRWNILKINFQTLEAIFLYKGVFFTKVVKANIIAFIKTKILRPVLSVKNPPFQKCQPLLHSAMAITCTGQVTTEEVEEEKSSATKISSEESFTFLEKLSNSFFLLLDNFSYSIGVKLEKHWESGKREQMCLMVTLFRNGSCKSPPLSWEKVEAQWKTPKTGLSLLQKWSYQNYYQKYSSLNTILRFTITFPLE